MNLVFQVQIQPNGGRSEGRKVFHYVEDLYKFSSKKALAYAEFTEADYFCLKSDEWLGKEYSPAYHKLYIYELFKEGYLDELSNSAATDTDVSSIAAGLGISIHFVTNYDFILNFGLSSFFQTGTWISGFEKTIYQSLYFGPEVLLKMGSIEGLNVYGICELTRSLFNNISSNDKSIDRFIC